MAKLYDLARMTTATVGTGAITLVSAVSGYLTFIGAGASDGDVVAYGISDGTNSEVGTGTLGSSCTTLTRTVTKSTNANSAISLSGSAAVYITARAEDFNVLTIITASLGADVSMNNSSLYFDGPSVSQGSLGIWLATGAVTISNTTAGGQYNVKLWDGATVIASSRGWSSTANVPISVALSGSLATPAGNLRISVQDTGDTTGKIVFNSSGAGHDSTITAIRIG